MQKIGRAAACLAAAGGLAAPAQAGAEEWTSTALLRFADELSFSLDPRWGRVSDSYRTTNGLRDVRFNASMLTVHSAAALMGHQGPARNDERLLALAARLTAPGAYVPAGTPLPNESQAHAPGWNASISTRVSRQHVSIDARAAQALALAWRAGPLVGMTEELRATIRARIVAVAGSRFFRRPRLNQANWSADLHAARAVVTGSKTPLRRDYRRLLSEFAEHARKPRGHFFTSNLNAGYGLIYAPQLGRTAHVNRVSPTEYQNLVLSVLGHLPAARRAGMPRPGSRARRIYRAWQQRTLFGDWTHSGYPNWDTGLGLNRWHLTRYWAHAHAGLLAMAAGTGVEFDSRQRRWAAWILFRSFELYRRWADPATGLVAGSHRWPLDAPTEHSGSDTDQTASRFAATAAQAALLGLGDHAPLRPGAFFAADPDWGRVAISTPSYSTAILHLARGGYGGIELARLFDSEQRVLSGIGGRGPAAFGMRIRGGGKTLLDTQPGGIDVPRFLGRPRVHGGRNRGTFRRLSLSATAGRPGLRIDVGHTFTPTAIAVSHAVRSASRGRSGELRFPSFGSGAHVRIQRGGSVLPVGGSPRALRRGDVLLVQSAEGGYRVRLRTLPRNATVRIVRPARQPAAPDPGPTASVRFAVGRATVRLSTLIVPGSTL